MDYKDLIHCSIIKSGSGKMEVDPADDYEFIPEGVVFRPVLRMQAS